MRVTDREWLLDALVQAKRLLIARPRRIVVGARERDVPEAFDAAGLQLRVIAPTRDVPCLLKEVRRTKARKHQKLSVSCRCADGRYWVGFPQTARQHLFNVARIGREPADGFIAALPADLSSKLAYKIDVIGAGSRKRFRCRWVARRYMLSDQ